jgi:hypothetical protein
MREKRNTYRILAGKSEDKRPLERPWHTWHDNIKWILKIQDGREWTRLIWFRTGTSGRLL